MRSMAMSDGGITVESEWNHFFSSMLQSQDEIQISAHMGALTELVHGFLPSCR